jgi:hypothetical protein
MEIGSPEMQGTIDPEVGQPHRVICRTCTRKSGIHSHYVAAAKDWNNENPTGVRLQATIGGSPHQYLVTADAEESGRGHNPVSETVTEDLRYVGREELAKELHESERHKMSEGKIAAYGPQIMTGVEEIFTFIEWFDLTEDIKEGYRMQADYLFEKYQIRSQ